VAESQQLREQLGDLSAEEFTASVTGLDPAHPLFALVAAEVRAAQSP